METTLYRVTFKAGSTENTFFSTAISREAGVEFVQHDEAGNEVVDIPTEMPNALERDLDACEDVISYKQMIWSGE